MEDSTDAAVDGPSAAAGLEGDSSHLRPAAAVDDTTTGRNSGMIGTKPILGQKQEEEEEQQQQQQMNPNASQENMHQAVIGKYRERGVFFSTCNLMGVALAALFIGRSRLSNLWIILVVAISSFFVFLQSKNISNSYIEEAQRLMRQEVSCCHS